MRTAVCQHRKLTIKPGIRQVPMGNLPDAFFYAILNFGYLGFESRTIHKPSCDQPGHSTPLNPALLQLIKERKAIQAPQNFLYIYSTKILRFDLRKLLEGPIKISQPVYQSRSSAYYFVISE